jgi:predicted nucleic acid-binding protein
VSYLLDTNVVSEWVKRRPDAGVVAWLADADEDRVFLSVMTLAELRSGIERCAAGKRRTRLDAWLREELPQRFEGRLLPIDRATADAWGKIVARGEELGKRINVADAFIAATAQVHGLTLVTRNVADFETALEAIVNPWAGA